MSTLKKMHSNRTCIQNQRAARHRFSNFSSQTILVLFHSRFMGKVVGFFFHFLRVPSLYHDSCISEIHGGSAGVITVRPPCPTSPRQTKIARLFWLQKSTQLSGVTPTSILCYSPRLPWHGSSDPSPVPILRLLSALFLSLSGLGLSLGTIDKKPRTQFRDFSRLWRN